MKKCNCCEEIHWNEKCMGKHGHLSTCPTKNKKRRFLCWIGWHSWTWTLTRVGEFQTEPITDEIPDRAVCLHCGVKYSYKHSL
jgi:hypothetical protein